VSAGHPPQRNPRGFIPRFRRNIFGWHSRPAIQRVRQAVAEINSAQRRDPMVAAEGTVLFSRRSRQLWNTVTLLRLC
jgi:hypothetical protein